MSRADDLRAEYEQRLALAEAEDRLVELKESGDAEALAAHKHEVRQLRRTVREAREGVAAAAPETVTASMDVVEVDG